ncbi:MAG TPA: hypothetical protein VHX87_02905 [Galbitalea sp.]|jgi:hypothetical protein|nr:hypothetical protein [Galbitalea sp.]
MAAPLDLRRVTADRSLLGSLEHVRNVGLGGVLDGDGRGYRARRARPTGAAVTHGYAWRFVDQWTQIWWPQGIAVGEHSGVPTALVSWYAQPRRRGAMGARISVVDLRNPSHATYRHVLLVAPRQTDAGVVLDPVPVHAGGIVWAGDRLFVAATLDGILEFRLSDILRADSRGPFGRASGPFHHRYLLPVFARYQPTLPKNDNRMRYSFLSLETGQGDAASGAASDLRMLAGEYATDDGRRVARLTLTDAGCTVTEAHVPRVPHMQGVALVGDRWYVSSGHGGVHGGDLWSGPIDNLRKSDGVLPPGPEALAFWPSHNELWSVSEVAGRRWLFAIDQTRF